jgi:hypothetical protein
MKSAQTAQRIKGQLPKKMRVRHMAWTSKQQRIAIWRCTCGCLSAYIAGAAWAVIHDKLLPHAFREFLCQCPRYGIRTAAGGEGHDDTH